MMSAKPSPFTSPAVATANPYCAKAWSLCANQPGLILAASAAPAPTVTATATTTIVVIEQRTNDWRSILSSFVLAFLGPTGSPADRSVPCLQSPFGGKN